MTINNKYFHQTNFCFLVTIIVTINSERNTDNKFATIENRAIRGSIISADGYSLSYSQKHYRAEINSLSIDPKKKELFINKKWYERYRPYSDFDKYDSEITKSYALFKSNDEIRGGLVRIDVVSIDG